MSRLADRATPSPPRRLLRSLVTLGGRLLSVAALLLAPAASAQQLLPLGFKNLEGVSVSGLQLDLEAPRCDVSLRQTGPFASWEGGRRELRLFGGTLDPEQSVRLQLVHDCSTPPVVREWWWTDREGERMGLRKRVRQPEGFSFASSYQEQPHFQVITFHAPEGFVELILPKELVAGERVSGTVRLRESGESARDRERNLGDLRLYSLSLGAAGLALDRPRWPVTLPADGSQGFVEVSLWNADGVLETTNVAPLGVEGVVPAEVTLPAVCQAEAAFEVDGPFDGDPANTRISLGGTTATILTESPRRVVALAPSRSLGVVEARVEEANRPAVNQTVRNVLLSLQAPKKTIGIGEQLDLDLKVEGLRDLDLPLQLEVINMTVGLAHFRGDPSYRLLTIQPRDAPQGVYNFQLQLEGNNGGEFDIVTRVKTE